MFHVGRRQGDRLANTLASRFRVFALARHRLALLHVDSVVVHLGVVKAVVEILRPVVCIQNTYSFSVGFLCSIALRCRQAERCGDDACYIP